jgi:hypothetical protein
MSTITIQIPEYLRQQVEKLSSTEGYSIDQFFATAASEKLSVIQEFDYVAKRASEADDGQFKEVLKHIPATPVTEDWDRLPGKPAES